MYTMSKGLGPLQIKIMEVIMDGKLTSDFGAQDGWYHDDLTECVYDKYPDEVTKNQKRSLRRALQSLERRGKIYITDANKDYKKTHPVEHVEIPPDIKPKPIPEPNFFCAWCKSEIFSETFDKHLREKHGSNLAKYRKLFGEVKKLDE